MTSGAGAPPEDGPRYRILIAVAKPDTARAPVDFATMVARTYGGELILLHVADHGSPLADASDPVPARERMVRDIEARVEAQGISVRSIVMTGEKPAGPILRAADEAGADLIVMGWRGRSRHPEALVGSNIDRVLGEARAGVAVLRATSIGPPARIFIPVANPRQAKLMVEIGEMFCAHFGSTLHLWHGVPPGIDADAREARLEALDRALASGAEDAGPAPGDASGVSAETPRREIEVEETAEILPRIAELASRHQFTIIGAAGEGGSGVGMTGAHLAEIAENSTGRLLIVRRRRE